MVPELLMVSWEARWLKLGYNLSDPSAEWLTVPDDDQQLLLSVMEAEKHLRPLGDMLALAA